MGQVFRPRANAIFRTGLVAAIAGVILLGVGAIVVVRSGAVTGIGRFVEQPVPFSHKHHVGGLGIGCQYCHTSAEISPVAGLPPTETCMTCHSQLWTNAEMLRPVRESLRQNTPIRWKRVHDLPDHVYFDHSIHVAKGVGCETCHGRVDRMALTYKAEPMQMYWCLECHRHPEPHLRPQGAVVAMGWHAPEGRQALGRQLAQQYGLSREVMLDCSTCHR